jgi:hypothetical protein
MSMRPFRGMARRPVPNGRPAPSGNTGNPVLWEAPAPWTFVCRRPMKTLKHRLPDLMLWTGFLALLVLLYAIYWT